MKRKKKSDPEGLVRGIREPGDKPSDASGIWATEESAQLSDEERARRAQERFERVRREAWKRHRP